MKDIIADTVEEKVLISLRLRLTRNGYSVSDTFVLYIQLESVPMPTTTSLLIELEYINLHHNIKTFKATFFI